MLTTVNKIYRKKIYIILSKYIDNHTICLCISIFYIAVGALSGVHAGNVNSSSAKLAPTVSSNSQGTNYKRTAE